MTEYISTENMDPNSDSLGEQLDKLAISILNTLQDIIAERQYLDDNLKEGYINMAKSRYLMRGRIIGMTQVNSEKLISTCKVSSCPDFVEGVEFVSFDQTDACSEKEVTEKLKKGLTITDENETDSCETNDRVSSPDPLRWFGVLVPDSLRDCQSRFKQATTTALKIASLQNQLHALGTEYRKLRGFDKC